MNGQLDKLESTRRRLKLRQFDVAQALEVTQGHYSKVVARRTPLTAPLANRIEAWLGRHGEEGVSSDHIERRMAQLAASIQAQCSELLALSAQSGAGK